MSETADPVEVARRMKAEDVAMSPVNQHRRTGPMCGPHKADQGTIEQQKLVADAILLYRAAQALRRRYPSDTSDGLKTTLDNLDAISVVWRSTAEYPDRHAG